LIGARRMVITRSRDEEIADDDDDDVTDPTDSVVTHSQEIPGDVDGDDTELSGIPFWAVDAETERVKLPLPPDAFPTPGPTLLGGHDAEDRAVTFFDLGIALRAQHRDAEALDAWEKALALAPQDPIYKEAVRRLRTELHS
jgi:tetratricopeptide (TPR) repeat protein